MLLIVAAINFCFGPLNVALPVISNVVFKSRALGFSWMLASIALGGLIGAIVIGQFWDRVKQSVILIGSMFGMAIPFGLIPLCKDIFLCLLPLFISGISIAFTNIVLTTFIQRKTPDYMRGKVNSMVTLIALSIMPISMAVSGALIDFLGTDPLFYLCSGLMVVVIIFFAHSESIKEFSEKAR